jgi:solute:Na+ symporter, SSS family
MTVYDYIVIGFYLVFMFMLGPIYKSFSKTSSDFFRGGGGMLWWVVGSSAFMTTFTAWAFTGGAAKAYTTGTFFLVIFACNIAALIFCYLFVVAKYRQMRIITVMEGVRKRYGKASEQSLTCLLILTKILYGGAMLYAIAVFMASVFSVPMPYMIIGLGAIITLMTVFGGSWSATAGDFVQMIVVLLITVIMGVLTLIKVGGVGKFIEQVPDRHFDWTQFDRPSILVVFIIALCMNQLIQMNSLMEGAARFIFVKDAKNAKKAILIQMVGMAVLPFIWIVPPMMAAVWHPDLALEYPDLNTAEEAAYVAMAVDLLPAGLFGLLVCAIFAATVTSLNSQLNIVGGSFVRNLYIQVIRPLAPEKEQILAGRVFMLFYGAVWISLGLCFQQVKGLELFDLLLLIAAATGLPLAVPLFLGIFFKKTPPWTGWSTMVAGFVPAAILGLLFKVEPVVQWLWRDPDMTTDEVIRIIWRASDLNPREIGDLKIAITTAMVALVCTGWFFLTMLFYRKDKKPYVDQVDDFFKEMATPIQPEERELDSHDNDSRQCVVLSNLCLIYGAFIFLLVFIPNEMTGRIIIFGCSAIVVGIGLFIKRLGRKYAQPEKGEQYDV